jgi:hypothetical protein
VIRFIGYVDDTMGERDMYDFFNRFNLIRPENYSLFVWLVADV